MKTSRKGFLKLFFITLFFLALMVAWLGFGERGIIHLYRMEEERQASMERIHKLEEDNQEMIREIDRLRTDKEYIESVARSELGLIKENEMIYRFSGKDGNQNPIKGPEK
jgi:cell division protein FtsB